MKNYIKKTLIIVAVLACTNVFAKEISIGGKDGWPELDKSENITTGKGRFGYESLTLDTNSFKAEFDTDLILNFEDAINPISYGNYKIISNNLQLTRLTELGKGAGLSRGNGGISIEGDTGTFFGESGLRGSFTIEFWLNPSLAENGEIVFNWRSSRTNGTNILYQMIYANFSGGHIEWTLSNIFDLFFSGNEELKLVGHTTIVPDTWSYHVLSFDAETGLLEYLVNGLVEDLKFITSTQHEGGDISLVVLGVPASIDICPEYTGVIDDFRITNSSYHLPPYQSADNAGSIERMKYIRNGGYFRTKPIMISTGSTLNSIDVEMDLPSQTAVNFYVRSGDNQYNWTETNPEWKLVESGEKLSGVSGLYFQVAAELYPDGGGFSTPTITEIKLDYTELSLPYPPFSVKAIAGNGSVTLTWNYSVDETAGGYYIYYGNRSGEYLGRIAVEGDSPIKVGNINSYTLTGLENGTIYYFAVATWSKHNDNVIGNLSKEVFARPRKN